MDIGYIGPENMEKKKHDETWWNVDPVIQSGDV